MSLHAPNKSGLRRALPTSTVLAVGYFLLACPDTAWADTPAQARQAIQAVAARAATSYGNRDLSGFVAMFSPAFVMKNVTGKKTDFRQNQADAAVVFARNDFSAVARCTVSQVVLQGNQALVSLHWHYSTRHLPSASASAYTIVRDYEERTTWKKLPRGWQEITADMTHDVLDYRR